LPVGLGVVDISIIFPKCDFVDEGLFVRDTPVEALGRKDAKLGFRHIEPTAVMMVSSHHRMDKDALVASLFLMDRPHVKAKGNPP
jgi:hypothetical protein